MTTARLELRGVQKRFGGVAALDSVSLHVRPGSIAGLIGPNGAGKTTVVNIVTGQLAPDGGDILLDGVAVGGKRPHQLARLGVARTFQNIRLYRRLTVRENIVAGMHLHRRFDGPGQLIPSRRARPPDAARQLAAARLLSLVGLDAESTADRLAGTLAYGDQRRLEIARALAQEPRLLLLDEPAAGMNSAEKTHLRELLRQLNADGLTIVLIDHDTKLVLGVCDEVTVLHFGRRIAAGPPAEIAADEAVITAYLGTARARRRPEGDTEPAPTGQAVDEPATPDEPAGLPTGLGGGPDPSGGGSAPLLCSLEPAIYPQIAHKSLTTTGERRPADPAAGRPLLIVEHLAVRYGPIEAVADVSLVVARGEIVTLIGANGAGKSTVLHALSGLVRPCRGTARFAHLDLTTARPPTIVRSGLVQVPEGREILTRLSVEDNLLLGGWVSHDAGAVAKAVEEMVEKFPILGQRRRLAAGQLSGGEQQVLAIARALIARPLLLLLDEPSLGLAPQLAEEVFALVEAIRDDGITVLLVEQNARRALELADRAYVVETGRVVLSGTSRELRDHPDVQQAYLGTG